MGPSGAHPLGLILGFLGRTLGLWGCWGSFWGSRRSFWGFVGGSRRRRKWGQKCLKLLKIHQTHVFLSLLGPWEDPKTRATASFQEAKNAISLHLAAISHEKSAWNSVKHKVLKFQEKLKPCILRVKMHFFKRFKRPNGRKSRNFMKKTLCWHSKNKIWNSQNSSFRR